MDKFLHFYPEVPRKIVEVLSRTLLSLAPSAAGAASGNSGSSSRAVNDDNDASSSSPASDDEKRLLLSLILCLGEWVMRMPRHILTQPQEDGRSLLFHVFAALQVGEPKEGENIGLLLERNLIFFFRARVNRAR